MNAKTQRKIILLLFAISTAAFAPFVLQQVFRTQEPRGFAQVAPVAPTVETQVFPSGSGDIADDSAIWYNAANPSQSVVFADNKDNSAGGIAIYDLGGSLLQFRQDGYFGNIDVRNGFQLGSQQIVLVGTNDRGRNTIALYKYDPSSKQVTPIPGTRATSSKNYGFCFYHNKQTGKMYAFVPHESGLTEQHELVVNGSNINTTKVRSFEVGSQSEGCAADDELGHLYVGQESTGLWKYSASPTGGNTRTAVDSVDGGNMVTDVEGVTIAYGPNGTGYIFASNQDDSFFTIYRREGNNAYVKSFSIGSGSGSIDAVSSTDGIDVMNANFGSAFPKGLFVAHDASNTGGSMSNLKFVPLQLIVDMSQTTTQPPPTGTTGGPTSPPPTIPQGSTGFSFNLFLHGIGKAGDNTAPGSNGNMSPLTPQRELSVEIINSSNTVVKTVTGPISFNATSGNFTGIVNAGSLANGVYQLRIRTQKYLWKRYEQVFQVTNGQTVTVPQASLVAGDIDGNNLLTVIDYNFILECFSDLDAPAPTCTAEKKAASDLTDDGNVNQFDYNLFLREIGVQCGSGCGPSPTAGGPTVTIVPTGVTPNPPQSVTEGIWISQAEIMKLPMSGAAWDKVRAAANSNWGSACMYDLTCMHDVNTLAGALVAVRTNDTAMKNKVIAGLQSAMSSRLERALETSRNIQSYIIAADIIGYRTPQFETWIRNTLNANLQGHGGDGVLGTAYNSANNWGGHARAAVAAAAIYLNDATLKQKVVLAEKAFIGMPAPGNTMVYEDTTWHADPSNKAGVNRKGAVINGKKVSGVTPEDYRRNSFDFAWPPPETGYMWGANEGFVVTAVILHRANLLPFNSGDNAVVRSLEMLYGMGEAATNSPLWTYPAEGDDTWIPWVVNYYAGSNIPTTPANSGKNMGWTDWTHAK